MEFTYRLASLYVCGEGGGGLNRDIEKILKRLNSMLYHSSRVTSLPHTLHTQSHQSIPMWKQ